MGESFTTRDDKEEVEGSAIQHHLQDVDGGEGEEEMITSPITSSSSSSSSSTNGFFEDDFHSDAGSLESKSNRDASQATANPNPSSSSHAYFPIVTLCKHKLPRSSCQECKKAQNCIHNRLRRFCQECGGNGLCKHKKNRAYCVPCGGSAICEHKRERAKCKDCKGSAICPHSRQKYNCIECGGPQVCLHKKLRRFCVDCGGSGICEHKKRRYNCRICGTKGAAASSSNNSSAGTAAPSAATSSTPLIPYIPAAHTPPPVASEESLYPHPYYRETPSYNNWATQQPIPLPSLARGGNPVTPPPLSGSIGLRRNSDASTKSTNSGMMGIDMLIHAADNPASSAEEPALQQPTSSTHHTRLPPSRINTVVAESSSSSNSSSPINGAHRRRVSANIGESSQQSRIPSPLSREVTSMIPNADSVQQRHFQQHQFGHSRSSSQGQSHQLNSPNHGSHHHSMYQPYPSPSHISRANYNGPAPASNFYQQQQGAPYPYPSYPNQQFRERFEAPYPAQQYYDYYPQQHQQPPVYHPNQYQGMEAHSQSNSSEPSYPPAKPLTSISVIESSPSPSRQTRLLPSFEGRPLLKAFHQRSFSDHSDPASLRITLPPLKR